MARFADANVGNGPHVHAAHVASGSRSGSAGDERQWTLCCDDGFRSLRSWHDKEIGMGNCRQEPASPPQLFDHSSYHDSFQQYNNYDNKILNGLPYHSAALQQLRVAACHKLTLF